MMTPLAALAVSAFVFGCAEQPKKTDPKQTKTATKDDHKHDDHDHGDGHHHDEHGPHDGTIADWGGGKYHIEFTVNHDKKEAAVYILGDDAKTAKPIKAKDGELLLTITQPSFQVKLKATPQQGDPEGTSSLFVGTNDNLGKVQEFAGTVSGEVDGTPYAGDFKELPHDHNHDHGDHDDK
jgi:hypothetical protein